MLADPLPYSKYPLPQLGCSFAIHALRKVFAVALLVICSPLHATPQKMGSGPPVSGLCIACHGIDGNSLKPNYPKLAGQPGPYIFRQLMDFKEGRRKDPNMSLVADNLSREDILSLADFFSSQKRPVAMSPSPPIAPGNHSKKESGPVANCLACHESKVTTPNRPPYIKGQQFQYLVKQLSDYRNGRRTNDGHIMAEIVTALTDVEIEKIAKNLAQLKP